MMGKFLPFGGSNPGGGHFGILTFFVWTIVPFGPPPLIVLFSPRKVKKIAHKILSRGVFELSTYSFSILISIGCTTTVIIVSQIQYSIIETRIYSPPRNPHFSQLEVRGFF